MVSHVIARKLDKELFEAGVDTHHIGYEEEERKLCRAIFLWPNCRFRGEM